MCELLELVCTTPKKKIWFTVTVWVTVLATATRVPPQGTMGDDCTKFCLNQPSQYSDIKILRCKGTIQWSCPQILHRVFRECIEVLLLWTHRSVTDTHALLHEAYEEVEKVDFTFTFFILRFCWKFISGNGHGLWFLNERQTMWDWEQKKKTFFVAKSIHKIHPRSGSEKFDHSGQRKITTLHKILHRRSSGHGTQLAKVLW